MKILILLLFALAVAHGEKNLYWNFTDVDVLKSGLLQAYDKLNRPSDYNTPTKLTVSMTVINFDVVESSGMLETHAWFAMNWTDSKLKWEPKDHNEISQLRVTADEIWQPDLTVYNSARNTIMEEFTKTNKIAYSSGMVLWVPTAKLGTYCNMDLKMWPFDEQKCTIKLGSWTYDATQIQLSLNSKPIELSHYIGSDWIITSSDAEYHKTYYPCCPEAYEDVTFTFTIKRNSPMYKAITLVPIIAIVSMVLTSFWLPPQAGEKLVLNGFASVLVAFILMYFSQLFPIMAESSPLIVNFYSNTLYLLAASFVISVIVINMAKKSGPMTIKAMFMDGFLEKAIAYSKPEPEKAGIEGATAEQTNKNWTRAAVIIDRCAFVAYLVIFTSMGFFHFV